MHYLIASKLPPTENRQQAASKKNGQP